jgi:bacteriorhodopsin
LHDERLHHICHQVAGVTLFLFVGATVLLMVMIMTSGHPESFTGTFFVTSIASAAYFGKFTGTGDANIFGTVVPWVRYLDWIVTTPLMLYEVCTVGAAPKHITMMIIGCDLLMLAFGIISALTNKKRLAVKYTWFFVASFFFILMCSVLHVNVANGSAQNQPPDVQTLFSRLEWLTIITWSLYPLVVLLGRAHSGLISKDAEDMMLCFTDTIAKLGMEGLIVASCADPDAMCH